MYELFSAIVYVTPRVCVFLPDATGLARACILLKPLVACSVRLRISKLAAHGREGKRERERERE